MSGGEALLRPGLVRQIADHARQIGAHSHLLSGMFFARLPRIPKAVKAAIDAVDHFSASIDAFHEEEVPRAVVFRVLQELLNEKKDVSLQLVGLNANDPYLADLIDDVRTTFNDRVPMFVVPVVAHGRANDWLVPGPRPHHPVMPLPCSLAAWPVVGFNGQVTACGNQDVMDGKVPLPAHLLLGHIATDDWATIKQRCLSSPMVRALRTTGPRYLAQQFDPRANCEGYCETCWGLSKDSSLRTTVEEVSLEPKTCVVESVTQRIVAEAGPVAFAQRHGIARYAELVMLGYSQNEEVQCVG
jgi:hypothetical protein